jgi:hypothetical protein
MKRKNLLMIFAVVIIINLLSGCIQNNDTNGENKVNNPFVGTWEATAYYIAEDQLNESELEIYNIYENGTIEILSSDKNEIYWIDYYIYEDQICVDQSGYLFCYYYEFSDDKNDLLLFTGYTDPDTDQYYETGINMVKIFV